MGNKGLKVLGLVLSVLGLGLGLAQDIIKDKTDEQLMSDMIDKKLNEVKNQTNEES